MKPELFDKWIAALRGGEYEQAKQRLRRNDSFCCLGVLCDVSGEGVWKGTGLVAANPYYEVGSYRLRQSTPTESEVERIPRILGPLSLPNAVREHAMKMNDEGFNFSDIADYLEAHRKEIVS